MKIVNKERVDKLTGKQGNKLTRKQVDKGLCRAALLRAFSLVTSFTRLLVNCCPRLLVTFSACLLFTLTSCDRRELTYYETAQITLTADWSQSGLEGEDNYGATAVFYPQAGGEPKIVLMGDRTRTTTQLPEGRYNVVLFNRSFDDFSAIDFRGTSSFATLEAYAKKIESRAESETIVSSPEKLAVAVVQGFEVTEDMLGNNYAPASSRKRESVTEECCLSFIPHELTRTIKVKINVDGLNNVKEATCHLSGVPVSIFLSDGHFSERTVTQEFPVGNPVFEENSYTKGTLTGEINVFGFDEKTEHDIEMDFLLVDGKTEINQISDKVDISSETDETGSIVLHIEAATPESLPDVKNEDGANSGFDADVDPWGDEESAEFPL